MIQLDENKLGKLKTTNQSLDEKYGKHGTVTREAFNEKAMAWYYGDLLRDRRKELKLTQKQLADYFGINVMAIYRYENNKNKPSQVNKIKFENKMKEWEEQKNV